MYRFNISRKVEIKMFKSLYYIRKAIFTVFIATFLLAVGAAITAAYTLEQYESVSAVTEYDTPVVSTQKKDPQTVGYCIKDHDGMIGIYDASGELMYTVEVYVKTLPARDRELLKDGIYANSYGEVLEILGDYTA